MKKVVLGKPQNPGDFEARHRWLLHSMHEIELASAVRDPELDEIVKRLDAIDARLDAADASLDARLDAIEARLDALGGWAMIRLAEIDDIGRIIDDLGMPFHAECGLAPLNMQKLLAWVTQMVSEGRVILSMRGEEIAGGIGIQEVPLKYADKSLLCDEFFFVRVEWRNELVANELRKAFMDLAAAHNQIGILTVFNPGSQSRRRRVSDLVGFIPFGYMLRLG